MEHKNRRSVVIIIFLSIGIVFSLRLMYLQLFTDKWKHAAYTISHANKTIQPSRGVIYDRNGKLLANNNTVYDLYCIPKNVNPFDTIKLAEIIQLNPDTLKRIIQSFPKKSKSRKFVKQNLDYNVFENFAENQYKFEGFDTDKKILRNYPEKVAAQILGYVREVSEDVIKKDKYYHLGDLIGIKGIEKYYEKELRGKRGEKEMLVDVSGATQEDLNQKLASAGENINLTVDAELQAYGEKLMQNKIGSIVAIEPSSGEILTVVSAPTYNPDLLTGDSLGKNYVSLLNNDSLRPLYNRATLAEYPPGSIFKMVSGLIAIQEEVIDFNTAFTCNKNLVKCHGHAPPSNLKLAIQYSCNPYFYQALEKFYNKPQTGNLIDNARTSHPLWEKYVNSFGFGIDLNIDYPKDAYRNGNIPTKKYYDKKYKNKWVFKTIYSNSIGQGEIKVTPLQMANLASIIANRGFYYTPHFGKDIKDWKKNRTMVNNESFEPIVEAMQHAVEGAGGTAGRARIDSISVCGKTGTAQNPHGKDHSVFIAFAPKDNPQIAIAVYVENAGFGGTWAAPIASLMIERYINRVVKQKYKERRILDAVILPKKKK